MQYLKIYWFQTPKYCVPRLDGTCRFCSFCPLNTYYIYNNIFNKFMIMVAGNVITAK